MPSNGEFYQQTEWHTGDIITQPKMMNIEDWLASASDELMEARTGHTILRDINTWSDLSSRLEYLTTVLSMTTPEGVTALIDELAELMSDAQEATDRANDSAELIENMTVAASTLAAGSPASVIRWERVGNKYELELGIPVPSFTTSTTTTYDGTTAANVTVNNSNSLTRNLAFSIPVPKLTVKSTSPVTSGNISNSAEVTITDNTTLNPKLDFKIPVATPQKGTVTTRSTGNVDSANLFTLSDTTTLTPKLNFEIPVQKIKEVQYVQATPGTAGSFEIIDSAKLDPTLKLTVPVQNIAQVTAASLAPGQNPTASLENIDSLNLRLNLGLPLAKPIDVVKTYSSVAALQSNIANDVAVGYYAIVASSEADEDNGKIYLRTSTSPYYSFIADISAATPYFKMGTLNVVDVNTAKAASIDITDPTEPTLNLTIPAVPVINSTVNMSVVSAEQNSSATISGAPTNTTLNLTIPAIPKFQQNVNVTNNESSESRATATITGTADNLVLNLNFPPDISSTPATSTRLGAIKIGDSLTIDSSGVVNTIRNEYELNITTNDWVLDNNIYTYTISNISNVTSDIRCQVYLDDTYFNLISSLSVETTDSGEIIFITQYQPVGAISGIFVLERTNQED